MPAEPDRGRLDPVRILHSLPQQEQDAFLTAYRRAVTAAEDPEGFSELLRLLRLWAKRAVAIAAPGYTEARAAARGPLNGGILLDSAGSDG
jgi:hypothetical protein